MMIDVVGYLLIKAEYSMIITVTFPEHYNLVMVGLQWITNITSLTFTSRDGLLAKETWGGAIYLICLPQKRRGIAGRIDSPAGWKYCFFLIDPRGYKLQQ